APSTSLRPGRRAAHRPCDGGRGRTPRHQGGRLRPWRGHEPVRRDGAGPARAQLPPDPRPLLRADRDPEALVDPDGPGAAAGRPVEGHVHGRGAGRRPQAPAGQGLLRRRLRRRRGAAVLDRAQAQGLRGAVARRRPSRQPRAPLRRPDERPVPRRARAAPRAPRRAQRRQRGRPRELRPRRRGQGVSVVVADRGAEGAGDRGAHVRDHDEQARRGLRPLPRHALAGLRRRRGRDAVDRRGRRGDALRGRHARRAPGRHVLLLHQRRADRERRVRVRRRAPQALAEVGGGPVRQGLAAPPLGLLVHARSGEGQARLARQGLAEGDQGRPARRLPSRGQGRGHRQQRDDHGRRRDASSRVRPLRLVGVLHDRRRAGEGRRRGGRRAVRRPAGPRRERGLGPGALRHDLRPCPSRRARHRGAHPAPQRRGPLDDRGAHARRQAWALQRARRPRRRLPRLREGHRLAHHAVAL
ncbi:MAG: Stage II sporulation protein D, partial [uncultured Solirubrobacteraceae bacterium]